MVLDILTKEDLQLFKKELLDEIREIVKGNTLRENGDREWLRSREVRKKLKYCPEHFRIFG